MRNPLTAATTAYNRAYDWFALLPAGLAIQTRRNLRGSKPVLVEVRARGRQAMSA